MVFFHGGSYRVGLQSPETNGISTWKLDPPGILWRFRLDIYHFQVRCSVCFRCRYNMYKSYKCGRKYHMALPLGLFFITPTCNMDPFWGPTLQVPQATWDDHPPFAGRPECSSRPGVILRVKLESTKPKLREGFWLLKTGVIKLPILRESNNTNVWSFGGTSLVIMHCLSWEYDDPCKIPFETGQNVQQTR